LGHNLSRPIGPAVRRAAEPRTVGRQELNTTLLVIGTLAIPSILMMGRIALLNTFATWRLISTIAVVVALSGAALFLVNRLPAPEAIAMAAPMYHLLLFRAFHAAFVRWAGREPRDTSLQWGPGLGSDRLFSFSFYMVAIFSVFAAIGPMIWESSSP